MAGTAKIPLSRGAFAVVDEDDYEWLTGMGEWHLSDTGYAVRRTPAGTVRMHRLVAGTPEELITDHLNGNRLDNRRSNLRTVNNSQNMRNVKTRKYYTWDKSKNMWMVRYNGIFYGRYKTEEEAAKAAKDARSGKPRQGRLHARRKYLPKGVCYMQPNAVKGQAPYYIRPLIAGKKQFRGYFGTIAEAQAAYKSLTAEKRVTSFQVQ